jgi:hypothetical protein
VSPFPTRSEQGIPALGVVLLLGCAVYVAALADVLFTGSLGWGLGAVLVAGSALAAARVARRDLLFAVVAPPLAFAAGTLAVVPFTAASSDASFPLGTVLAFAGALGGGAPLLGSAVLAAGVLALVRWELDRRGMTQVEPAGAPGGEGALGPSQHVHEPDAGGAEESDGTAEDEPPVPADATMVMVEAGETAATTNRAGENRAGENRAGENRDGENRDAEEAEAKSA